MSRCTSNAMETTPLIGRMFNQHYDAGREYRSTTVVLNLLEGETNRRRIRFPRLNLKV